MLEHYVRPHYQRYFVDNIVTWAACYVTPIQVTLFSGILGLMVPVALFFQYSMLAISLLLASGYLDTLDGTIARHQQSVSDLGSLLDIFTDRLVECSVILGLWLTAPLDRSLMSLLMLGSILLCVTSFLTVGIFSENHSQKSFHYSAGLIERAEAFIFFILMILFPQHFQALSTVFVILVLITTVLRLYEFSYLAKQY